MIYSLRFLVIFILFLSVSAQKSNYNNYQNQELIIFTTKTNDEVISKMCLVTSLPSDFKRVDKNESIKFYNFFYKENFDLCNITNASWDGSEAVFVEHLSKCGMVQQKANALVLKIKVIVYLTQHNISLPDYPSELSKPPAVVLMTKYYFNLMQQRIHWSQIKIGIYKPFTHINWSSKLTEVVTFSIVAGTILFTMIITITCTKVVIEGSEALDSSSFGQVKYFAIILPLFMVTMLLLMYFFFFVMVWIVIMAFYFLSAYCLSTLLLLPLDKYYCLPGLNFPLNKFGIRKLDFRFIGLYLLGLAVSTAWIVNRNNITGLILNNIMGVYVCVQIAISFGLMFVISKNFKILLVILVTVLLIDAVMVFVPIKNTKPDLSEQILLSFDRDQLSRVKRSDGNSIMESVATAMGGNNNEEIPIRFKIPKIGNNPNVSIDTCQPISRGYSLIGFGDLILPGAFIVFMMIFAVISKSSVTIYFLVTFSGYMCGLCLTYVALFMTMRGQPALIYLLPCTVLPTLLITIIRKEFMTLWHDTWFSDPSNNGFNELISNTEDTQVLPVKEEEM